MIYALTQKGPHKQENEDRILIGKTVLASGEFYSKEDCGIAAVADGVGGRSAGAVASHFVSCELSKVGAITEDSWHQINTELNEKARLPEYQGMATTLAGISLGENSKVFYVGNTRVYAVRNGKYLQQLTTDDTTVQYLLDTGKLTEEEAQSFDKKNEIIACMGGGSESLFKPKFLDIAEGCNAFLITSDGIHDYMSIDDMEDILAENSTDMRKALHCLAEKARENGSEDDISIVFYRN